jgi:predicted nucleic acid-binding protein
VKGDRLLVDTNIIIHVFEGHPKVVQALHEHTLVVSVLTRMELYAVPGITPERSHWVDEILAHCEIIPLLRPVQDEAVRLRRTYKIEMVDAIIVATAIVKGLPFISADKALMKTSMEVAFQLFEP